MSWLLFMDESGHDHKNTPMEVRGGVAIHSKKVWSFVQRWEEEKKSVFGEHYAEWGEGIPELKGSKLLERARMQTASRNIGHLDDNSRRKSVQRLLTQRKQKRGVKNRDRIAYAKACILMVESVFNLLEEHEAYIFASLIPQGVKEPANFKFTDFLRKDHVFLQERFFNFLEGKREHGLFVMDQTEKQQDKRFVKNLQNYYTKTNTGKERAHWIVPSPLFVDSEMSPCIQAADICIYCINWGFRLSQWEFRGGLRNEIATRFGRRIRNLQFKGEVVDRSDVNKSHTSYGIVYVPDPYTSRR